MSSPIVAAVGEKIGQVAVQPAAENVFDRVVTQSFQNFAGKPLRLVGVKAGPAAADGPQA